MPTGVDRVERAYLSQFARGERPFLAFSVIGKTAFAFRPNQIDEVLALLDQATPNSTLRQALSRWRLKKISSFRVPKQELMTWVTAQLGSEFILLSVGHIFANLPLFKTRPKASKLLVMVHDTIPLDFPQFQTPASVAKFKSGFQGAVGESDLIICNSKHTEQRVLANASAQSGTPRTYAIPLGVDLPIQQSVEQPSHSYFVQLGTIEPRKNHNLMLDVWQRLWEKFGSAAPHLYIVGRRGWMNDDVFRRLDNETFMEKVVFERNHLNDLEVQKLISGACALLFPSFAEGFGYPIFEARQLGIPALVSNIEVFREFDDPQMLYINGYQIHTWENKIEHQASLGKSEFLPVRSINACNVPRWSDHFKELEGILGDLR